MTSRVPVRTSKPEFYVHQFKLILKINDDISYELDKDSNGFATMQQWQNKHITHMPPLTLRPDARAELLGLFSRQAQRQLDEAQGNSMQLILMREQERIIREGKLEETGGNVVQLTGLSVKGLLDMRRALSADMSGKPLPNRLVLSVDSKGFLVVFLRGAHGSPWRAVRSIRHSREILNGIQESTDL